MNIKLNIQEDSELRQAIKEAIKGQVKSLVHEDLRNIAKEAMEKKLKNNSSGLDHLIQQAVHNAVREILHEKCGVTTWNESFVKPFVDERLTTVLKTMDWNRLVNQMAKEKVRSMIGD